MKQRHRKPITWVGIALSIVFLVSLGLQPALAAENSETPEWFFHDIVDVQFVMDHMTIPMEEKVMIIDARPYKPKYWKGHIPMAVSIPDSQFDKMTDKLPKDKDALLVFYCGGLHCKLSHKSARKAEALGYTNVKVFAEGFPAYMKVPGNYAAVDAEWMKAQLDKNADMAVVDSRPKRKKYDKGHLPKAISLPDMYFDKEKDKLPAEKDKPLVFYCGGFKCKLSHKSAKKALDMGYTNVKVFAAGYPAWKKIAGGGDVAKKAIPSIKAGEEEGSIDHAYFNELVSTKADQIYLVDVRDADEFAKGSLKSAVNIPVEELENKISTLPTDKPIVFICGTGARSGESFYMLQDLKPEMKNVFYIDGEMTFKKDGSFTLTKPASS
jgi:rhodanese-related sulfurtransferase